MGKQFNHVVLLAIVTLSLAGFSAGADRVLPNTPKGAYAQFMQAVKDGNLEAAVRICVTDPDAGRLARSMAADGAAVNDIRAALVEKFGKEAAESAAPGMTQNRDEPEITKVEIHGNTARLLDKEGTLIALANKVQGTWLVNPAVMSPDALTEATEKNQKITEILKQTGAEVRNGKYSSATDAVQAASTKIMSVLLSATTRPQGGGKATSGK